MERPLILVVRKILYGHLSISNLLLLTPTAIYQTTLGLVLISSIIALRIPWYPVQVVDILGQ